jgi:nitrogen regulatory protein PII
MKAITAYIKPFKLDGVTLALSAIDGLTGLTVSHVEGFGRGRGSSSDEPNAGQDIRMLHYVRLELHCADALVEEVVAAIHAHAHTGLRGDGKIYLSEVSDAIRISTGERGPGAI